jgi:type II secretory pathway component PulF
MKKFLKTGIHTQWKRRDILFLLERLELYLSSGLAIDKTLAMISSGMKPSHKKAVADICADVISGQPLSKSFAQSINISKNICGLIEQGELSGRLGQSVAAAHALLEREDELYKKCMSAMAYPVIIGVFSSLLTLGLVRGVMPQIIPMLKSLNVRLPLLTRIVIWFSEHLISYGLYIFLAGIVCIVLHSIMLKKYGSYRNALHNILIRIPLIGQLVYSYALSLFLQSCGVLIESGVPLTRAYAHTSATVALIPLRHMLEAEVGHMHAGLPLGSILADKTDRIPLFVPSLIMAGESSGTLGVSLKRAAMILDRDTEYALKKLSSLIEPVMMAGMGCVVGAIALSIMMPIYDISKVLQH